MLNMAFTTQRKVIDYRDTLHFDRVRLAAFVSAMQDRGVRLLSRGLWYISAAMTEADIDAAVAAARECLGKVAEGG